MMMDGRNSVGRKISLLNDSGDVAPIPSKPTAVNARLPSLLQHHQSAALLYQPPLNTLPPLFAPHTHSRDSSSSCTSTPCLSPPQTPQLVRSDSSDSRTFATPSPLTPSYTSFDQQNQPHHHHHHHHHHHGQLSVHSSSRFSSSSSARPLQQHYYFASSRTSSSSDVNAPASQAPRKMDDPLTSLYPPIPDATLTGIPSAYPSMQVPITAQQLPLQDPASSSLSMYRSSNSPASEPSRMSTISQSSTNNPAAAAAGGNAKTNTTAAAASAGAAPKKNQYPCPMAKQFNCSDFFTTSGHAARHAKKHTGKKDAFCPECNKAFTRKDNMEQHRRTHQNGRGRGTDDKVKKTSKTPKKAASVKSDQPAMLEAAVEQELEQQRLSQQAQQRQEDQQQQLAAQLQAVAQAQIVVAQQQQHLQAVEQALLNPGAAGPYFLTGLDAGPIPSLPMPTMNDISMRPPLHRSNLTTSLDYIPPLLGPLDPETLNYSYPSPGLSNGLNSLALAASEHRRISEEKTKTPPSEPGESPSTESNISP